MVRPLSRASTTSQRVPPQGQTVTETGYVIPKFDFEQHEIYEGPPDVDEVGGLPCTGVSYKTNGRWSTK